MVQGSYCIFSFLEAKGLNIVSDFPSTKKEFIFDHIKQLGLVLWRQTSIDWYVNMNHFSKIEKIFLKTINTPQCVIVENPVI